MNIENIKLEEIDFYGDKLLGGVDKDNNIWLAINKACQCLGFDEADSKNQITKIGKDEVLKKLSLKFQTEVLCEDNSIRTREMLFLSEKAITLWLAKISITANVKKKYPELSQKLIKYQLECASVLHNHFMGTEEKKANFFEETLNLDVKSLLNTVFDMQKQISELMHKINDMKDIFEVYENPSMRYDKLLLNFIAKTNGVGGLIPNNHKMFWEAICNYFDINIDEFYKNAKPNKKQYIINSIGIERLSYFINGVITNKIIKNSVGNWVSVQGYDYDKFGIEKDKITNHWTSKQGDLICAYCGKKIINPIENINYNYDHIIPKSNENSTDSLGNIIIACNDCNKEKNNMSYEEFIKIKNTHPILVQRKEDWCRKETIN